MQEELTGQEIYENNLINRWVEKYLKAKEELEEYKKSKQASYEALQARFNELELSNRKLKQECEEIRQTLIKTKEQLDDTIAPDISALEELPKEILNESLYSLYEKLKEKIVECEDLKKTLKRYNLYKELEEFIGKHIEDTEESTKLQLFKCQQRLKAVEHSWDKLCALFYDEYFKGLDITAIAELAKKSIRLTTENRKLEAILDEIEKFITNDGCNVQIILDIISKAKGKVCQ